MKLRSSAVELTSELENEIAMAMLIQKRHAGRIGSIEARELIEKVKGALDNKGSADSAEPAPQDLIEGFPVH